MSNIIYSVQQDNLTTDMGITPIFPNTIEDASKDFSGTAVVAGQCLALSTNAAGDTILVLGGSTTGTYGLAKETVNANININEVSDNGFGIFGSGKITACIFGVYEVKNYEYAKADGSVEPLTAIDFTTLATATPGSELCAADGGLITVGSTNAFGKLIAVADGGNTIQLSIGM